jgi:phosphatidylglycerophosphatase A
MAYHRFITKLIASFFYVGYLPLIPGTFASLAGLGVYFLVKDDPFNYFFAASVLIVLGFVVGDEAEKVFNKKDDRRIVIDEVCGMLVALAFLPFDARLVFWAFFLFRAFDTLKPAPAYSLQKIRGGAGVMLDDIIAGVYTNILLQVVWRVATFRGS